MKRLTSLTRFLTRFSLMVAATFETRLMGVYVNGSLTMGDFQIASSDIDFLVVTRDELKRRDLLRVRAMHRTLAKLSFWGPRLEGEYIGRWRLHPAGAKGPAIIIESGHAVFTRRRTRLTAENVRAFRDASLPLVGPAAREVLPRVPAESVRRALDAYLAQLLLQQIRRKSTILVPGAQAKALASWTLNIAGCLYGRRLGTPCTKAEAARWLSRRYPVLRDLLAAALAVRQGTATARNRRLLQEGAEDLRRYAQQVQVMTSRHVGRRRRRPSRGTIRVPGVSSSRPRT